MYPDTILNLLLIHPAYNQCHSIFTFISLFDCTSRDSAWDMANSTIINFTLSLSVTRFVSSVGRASDWRSEGPVFDSQTKHSFCFFGCVLLLFAFLLVCCFCSCSFGTSVTEIQLYGFVICCIIDCVAGADALSIPQLFGFNSMIDTRFKHTDWKFK